jgi:hypothetical protein
MRKPPIARRALNRAAATRMTLVTPASTAAARSALCSSPVEALQPVEQPQVAEGLAPAEVQALEALPRWEPRAPLSTG